MGLIVPFNGDLNLIGLLPTQVSEVYGKSTLDDFDGGRANYSLLEYDLKILHEAVVCCKERGFKFNYLLNSVYQSKPFNRSTKNKLDKLIQYLSDIGVSSITVSMPHFVDYIVRHYPDIIVTVSKFARVNSIERIQYWVDLGVHRICLDGNITKRIFLLSKMTKNTEIELILLVNDSCLEDCPFENYHAYYEAQHSQNKYKNSYKNYYSCMCKKVLMSNKKNILRSTFIRPEDLVFYKNIGIDTFKLADRNKSTEWIIKAVNAYAERKYDGNLADILNLFSNNPKSIKPISRKKRLLNANEIQHYRSAGYFDIPLNIKNSSLNGYIEGLANQACCQTNICDKTCQYCDEFAEKSVTWGIEKEISMNNLSEVTKNIF